MNAPVWRKRAIDPRAWRESATGHRLWRIPAGEPWARRLSANLPHARLPRRAASVALGLALLAVGPGACGRAAPPQPPAAATVAPTATSPAPITQG
jgi:hypothetical protein